MHRPRDPHRKKAAEMPEHKNSDTPLSNDFVAAVSLDTLGPRIPKSV